MPDFRNLNQIVRLAGCDLLTISPELLKELENTEGTVKRELDPVTARHSQEQRLRLEEKTFRWMHNKDAIATEKLAERIRKFNSDGKLPKIIRAICIKPIGKESGMKTVALDAGCVDPDRDDFFRKVIKERKSKDKTNPLYYFLKILANAGCHGIYAELNRHQTGKNDRSTVHIFSGEKSCTFPTRRVGGAGRNPQFHFGTCIDFAPHF